MPRLNTYPKNKHRRQTTCLRCGKTFVSPDPRYTRICPNCAFKNKAIEQECNLVVAQFRTGQVLRKPPSLKGQY